MSTRQGLGLICLLLLQSAFTCCKRFKKERWETAPLAKDKLEVTVLSEEANLRIERVRFFWAEMNEPRFFLALVPAHQRPVAEAFILNHGWFDRPEFLLTELKVDRVYADLLAHNKVRPAVVILPDVRFSSFYRQHSDRFPFPNYLTLVAEEVARTASQTYRVPLGRERWSIGGFSFGGYLSLDVGRRYAGRFGAVSVVSAFADEEWSFWPSTTPKPGRLDARGRGKHTVVEPGPIPRIFLACGTEDRFSSRMLALHDEFVRIGIAHKWSTGPGGHTWQYWSSVLGPMLEFHLGAVTEGEKKGPA